jgi:hypothetical protein
MSKKIYATDGEWLAFKTPTNYVISPNDGENIIADVYPCFTANAWDNAQLISASPLMYKALEDIKFVIDTQFPGIKDLKVYNDIETVLQKARGENAL